MPPLTQTIYCRYDRRPVQARYQVMQAHWTCPHCERIICVGQTPPPYTPPPVRPTRRPAAKKAQE